VRDTTGVFDSWHGFPLGGVVGRPRTSAFVVALILVLIAVAAATTTVVAIAVNAAAPTA